MTTSRRDFIVGTGAAIAIANLPARAAGDADGVAEKLVAEVAEELMIDYPESASSLGIDNGKRAALKSKLCDRSAAGQQAIAQRVAKRLQRIKAIDTSQLSEAARIDVDVMRTAHEFAAEGFALPYGDSALLNSSWSYRNAPYVVAQNTGAFLEIPGMLDEQHSVETPADADAYLARLELYAGQLDGETGRLKAAAAQNVIAPDFLLDKTLTQIKIARGGKIADWMIVQSLAKRTKEMKGDYAAKAEKIAKDKVAPALDRQIAELEAHRKRATSDAGVWKLPRGDRVLRVGAEDRHHDDDDAGADSYDGPGGAARPAIRDGRHPQEARLHARDGRRADDRARPRAAATASPTATKAARKVMEYLNGRITDIRKRLPRAFATLVPGNMEIKRMAPEVEPGAPGAYGGPGTIDGKVPGKFWINLGEMSNWTTYNLATLTYHESIPGHVWQGEYTFKLPLLRSLLGFNAYSEGWALYAEQLAAELGVYDSDPVGRLGYLQSIAFRACRLVVDTGLHVKKWTRQQAIQWFATTNGSSLGEVTQRGRSLLRVAWPGLRLQGRPQRDQPAAHQDAAGARCEVRPASVRRRGGEGRRRADGRAGAEHRRVHREA